MSVNIWLDDIRPAPEGYIWCKSVNQCVFEKLNKNLTKFFIYL